MRFVESNIRFDIELLNFLENMSIVMRKSCFEYYFIFLGIYVVWGRMYYKVFFFFNLLIKK